MQSFSITLKRANVSSKTKEVMKKEMKKLATDWDEILS